MFNELKVLVSGKDGQLMTDLISLVPRYNTISESSISGLIGVNSLKREDTLKPGTPIDIAVYDRAQWDITDGHKTIEIFEHVKPHIYINGASVHSVDDIEKAPAHAINVNVAAVHNLAKLCNKHDTLFVNISTNYIFRGTPYKEYSEDDKPDPVNLYGVSKYAGELVVRNECRKFINIRVSGLFGHTGCRAKGNSNFPLMILDKLKKGEKLEVVDDQTMNVGYTVDVATAILNLIGQRDIPNSTFHFVNTGILTWYDLAKFIVELKGYNKDLCLEAIKTDQYYTQAKRPMHTALENTKVPALPTWQSAVVRFLKEINEL